MERLAPDVLTLIRARVDGLQRRVDELEAENVRLRKRDCSLRARLSVARRARDDWKRKAQERQGRLEYRSRGRVAA